MEIVLRREDDGSQGGWYLDGPEGPVGEPLAEITYRWEGSALAILHTGVRDALAGKGVARRLVEAVVAAARDEGFQVVPRCPYAFALFKRRRDLREVVHPSWLERLDAP